jgi:mono/diheme cytochrome c family protein
MRWLLAAALALATAAATAMGGQNMVLGRIVLPRADAPSLTVASSARGHYVLHCAGCHRVDGSGTPTHYVPDLRRVGQFLQLDGGRAFVIGVPGVMGSGLNDAQVAEVANWLLATMARDSVPEGHQPYTAAEVATARQQPMADVAAVRQRLVEQARTRGIRID